MLDYHIAMEGGECRFTFTGELIYTAVDEVRKKAGDVFAQAQNTVVFDFLNLTRIDSSGIRFLIDSYKLLSEANRSMIIINVPEKIMATFKHMRLDTRLTIREIE